MKLPRFFTGLAITLCTLTIVTGAHASNAGAGTINSIIVLNGVVLFNQTGTRTTLPSCQNSGLGTRWAFNGATPAGQSLLSLLLVAYAMNKSITITGFGSCSNWGDTEDVSYIVTQD